MIEANLMPPPDKILNPKVEPLASEHRAVLTQWLKAGAPKSSETCN
jgi:hypothetical protein